MTVLPNRLGFSLIAPTALEATTATAIPEPIAASPTARAAAIKLVPLSFSCTASFTVLLSVSSTAYELLIFVEYIHPPKIKINTTTKTIKTNNILHKEIRNLLCF